MRTHKVWVTVERKEMLIITTPIYATARTLQGMAEIRLQLKSNEQITRIHVKEETK